MFELFDDRAIAALMIAQQEAHKLGQNYVGTELLLVGVVAQSDPLVTQVLKRNGLSLKAINDAVDDLLGKGSFTGLSDIPFTPAASQILEKSIEEARQFAQNAVGPEHLFLAMANLSPRETFVLTSTAA